MITLAAETNPSLEAFIAYGVPFLLVIAVAALLAFLLGYLGKKLEVKHDPKIDEVRANLAGANCGGCGYAGCDAFAQALVEGKAQITDCNPTSKEGKAAIGEILGMEVSAEETVAVVRCAGGKRAKDKYDYRGAEDCNSAAMVAGGTKQCNWGCMGMCSCVKVCEFDAIHVGEGECAQADKEACTSCGNCMKACPKALIARIPKSAPVYCACSNPEKGKAVMDVCEVGCIGCGLCAKACEHGAIKMNGFLPEFDYSKCVGCMKCAEKCPRHIILKH